MYFKHSDCSHILFHQYRPPDYYRHLQYVYQKLSQGIAPEPESFWIGTKILQQNNGMPLLSIKPRRNKTPF